MKKRAPSKLWILSRLEETGYDEAIGFVVRSASHWAARRHAAGEAGDEKGKIWMDPAKTSCGPLARKGKAGVVIRSFVSG